MILISNLQNETEKKDIGNSDVIFSNFNNIKEALKYSKKNKINKIYFIDGNKDFFILKIKNRWITYSNEQLNLTYIKSSKMILNSVFKFSFLNKFDSKNYDVEYQNQEFCYNQDQFESKVKFLNDENFYVNNKEILSYSYSVCNFKSNLNEFEQFIAKVESKGNLPGLPISNFNLNNNSLNILTPNSETLILFNEELINIITESKKANFSESKQYSDNLNINFKNNIKNITTNPPKISTKNIIISVIAFFVVILLTYVTFAHIFDLKNMSQSFVILGSSSTWKHPYIYILIVNFIITFFYSFFMMFIITIAFSKGKFNYKNTWNMFLGAQVRTTAIFLTGNFIIATVIWAYYLNWKSNMRVSSLVGMISVMGILRSIMQVIMAIFFLTPGTIYLASAIDNTKISIILFILGWGGLLWSSMHNIITSSVIFIPFLQTYYINAKTNILLRKNNSIDSIIKVNSEIFFTTKAFNSMFKNRETIFRMFLMTIGMTIFEAIETVTIFQIVEDYRPINGIDSLGPAAHYWEMLSISGVRLMSTYVHMFPALNLLPGQGMAITDIFMSKINEIVIAKEHGLDLNSLTSIQKQDIINFSQQATFITRFFNFYLKKIIQLLLTLYVVIAVIVKTHRKKYHNIVHLK